MGIMGGNKTGTTKPPKGYVSNPAMIYHGNPRNTEPGVRLPYSPDYVPRESLISNPIKASKNTLRRN